MIPNGAKRLDFMFATSWASPQLVYVLQEGYKLILDEFKDVKMIFLASGTDIPLQNSSILLSISKSCFAFTRSGNGGHQNRKDKLLAIPTKDLTDFGLLSQPKHISLQWIHVTGQHARMIAEYPLWKMQLLHSKLIQTYRHYLKTMPVADEYWPWTILLQCGVQPCDVSDLTLTQQDRQEPHDCSPILWTSLTQKRKIFHSFIDDMPQYIETTLQDILFENKKSGALFYRKVSSAVNSIELQTVVFDKNE
jgi:hypothetical protein